MSDQTEEEYKLEEAYDHLLRPIKEFYDSVERLIEKWSTKYPTANSEEADELHTDIKTLIGESFRLLPMHLKQGTVECPECNIHGIDEAFRHHTNVETIRQAIMFDTEYSLLFCHVCCHWWVHKGKEELKTNE